MRMLLMVQLMMVSAAIAVGRYAIQMIHRAAVLAQVATAALAAVGTAAVRIVIADTRRRCRVGVGMMMMMLMLVVVTLLLMMMLLLQLQQMLMVLVLVLLLLVRQLVGGAVRRRRRRKTDVVDGHGVAQVPRIGRPTGRVVRIVGGGGCGSVGGGGRHWAR